MNDLSSLYAIPVTPGVCRDEGALATNCNAGWTLPARLRYSARPQSQGHTAVNRALIAAIPLLAAAWCTTAQAHAILIDSTPAPLAHVPAGHLAVSFRYNSRIDAARSKLVLMHAETSTRVAQHGGGNNDTLQAPLDLTPGEYVIKWQVLATDGHITRGRVPFTVDAAP